MSTHAPFTRLSACRCCGDNLTDLVSFGDSPLADRLMRPDDSRAELTAPLTLALCDGCGLAQIRETVQPDVLFGSEYPYYSGVSPALVRHFRGSAQQILKDRALQPGALVVEAASNDGTMLAPFAEVGINVLGIDPAQGPGSVARDRGVHTITDFFTEDLAQNLAGQGRRADVFLANNVLAHVANPLDFLRGVECLLADDGIAVLEFPYLADLVKLRAFDTIYHQHLLYLSASSCAAMAERAGLFLNDVERIRVHGGSLRVTLSHSPSRSMRLNALLAEETRTGIGNASYFTAFCGDLARMRCDTMAELNKLRALGKTVVGYGAAAKATTMLQHIGIDTRHLAAIADKSGWKQGLEMPGTRIPIIAPDALERIEPDVVLILAWNFAREIIAENQHLVDAGVRFLVPVPTLRSVGTAELEHAL